MTKAGVARFDSEQNYPDQQLRAAVRRTRDVPKAFVRQPEPPRLVHRGPALPARAVRILFERTWTVPKLDVPVDVELRITGSNLELRFLLAFQVANTKSSLMLSLTAGRAVRVALEKIGEIELHVADWRVVADRLDFELLLRLLPDGDVIPGIDVAREHVHVSTVSADSPAWRPLRATRPTPNPFRARTAAAGPRAGR